MTDIDRRTFLERIATTTAALVLVPLTTSCAERTPNESTIPSDSRDQLFVPRTPPPGFDPIAFNRERGNAGAIPESYLPQINGEDGPTNHIGKHLPYVPELAQGLVPEGFIALMWGDPSKGHAPHPNAVRGPSNNGEGHWYDRISIRKATTHEAQERTSTYPEWPADGTDAYLVFGGGELTDDEGKNTIYLAALPSDVRSGDLVRVHAHCLTHGEYVDFVVVP